MVFIREINVTTVKNAVRDLCIEANCHLGDDTVSVLNNSVQREKSPTGREILGQIIENASIAHQEEIPMCQDTGFAVVFIEMGQEILLTGGNLVEAVNEGVREGYTKGFLRKSMVRDPIERVNTEDNTPAIVHIQIVPGQQIKIIAVPKGGGSENMSALKMLKPVEGVDGIIKFVTETVKNAGPNPCPPIVVGLGIGGTMEKAALMAKHALTRPLGQKSDDPGTAELEEKLVREINNLGIGPQGLGGSTTTLAVHIERFATHIACLPVAVNISCHAYRHKEIVI